MAVQAIQADDQTDTIETRLRQRLQDTMLQLRAAETDRATLQAAQAQSAEEKKSLTAKLEAITKQANANKLAAQAVESLKAQVSRQDQDIAQLKEAMESCRQAAQLARKKEAERDALVDQVEIGLERLVIDRQQKNLALYKIASEILDRYQKFGLGDAIAAREPFVGLTRVKLQNQVQDYQDKLLSERVTLNEKDLTTFRDKLLSTQSQTSAPDSGPPKQTSE